MLRNVFVEKLFEGLTARVWTFFQSYVPCPCLVSSLNSLLHTEPGEMKHIFEGGEGLAL